MQRDYRDATRVQPVWILFGDGSGHLVQLHRCLLEGYAGLEPRDELQVVTAAVGARPFARGHHVRHPHLGRLSGADWIGKSWWHHAQDLEWTVIQCEDLTDNAGIAAELLLPETIAQQRDAVASLHFLVGREAGSQDGSHAQHGKELVRDASGPDVLGFTATSKDLPATAANRTDPLEHLLTSPPIQIDRRVLRTRRFARRRLAFSHRDQTIGILERQPSQDNGVHDREDRRPGADSQGQYRQRQARDHRGGPERAHGVSKIAHGDKKYVG